MSESNLELKSDFDSNKLKLSELRGLLFKYDVSSKFISRPGLVWSELS